MASEAVDLKINILEMKEKHLEEVLRLARDGDLSCWSYEDYKREIERQDAICLIAESLGEKAVGFLVARLIMTEQCVELNNIAVNKYYRRLGVGNTLLDYLAKVSIVNSLDRILLEVRQSNEGAVKFYLKSGFTILSLRKGFYNNPPEDGLTMMKRLTAQQASEVKNRKLKT